jgi:hypothetical protein
MGIMKCKLIEVSHMEFQQNVWKGFKGYMNNSMMASCKRGFG